MLYYFQTLSSKHQSLVTAESCTGGGLAYEITSVPGSSEWFERGFVTYSNLAKQQMLGVKSETLEQFGAVSDQTAREMAEGALANSDAQVAISITGIAGPDGGTPDKPVGTVWFAWAGDDFPTQAKVQHFEGDRRVVREKAIQFSLAQLALILGAN